MALLNDETRAAIWRGLMRHYSRIGAVLAPDKDALRGIVDDTDAVVHAMTTDLESALSADAMALLTGEQRELLVAVLILARIAPGHVSSILGEIGD
jgi:hypothetical protein